MTREKKQEYTNRIINANKTEMIVILYDMVLTYIEEAKGKTQPQEISGSVKKARDCVDELKKSINFDTEAGIQLFAIYSFVNKLFSQVIVGGKVEKLTDCEKIFISMRETWKKIAQKDESKPVMENIETISAGYTYGKNDLNLNPSALNNRGFLV